jgi:hypothetical protein
MCRPGEDCGRHFKAVVAPAPASEKPRSLGIQRPDQLHARADGTAKQQAKRQVRRLGCSGVRVAVRGDATGAAVCAA